jgi:biotin-dependent carboxylase-like uncharacterized protein
MGSDNRKIVTVARAGPQTAVQDTGRPGYLMQGIPQAGPQDSISLRLANLLVGNKPGPPPLSCGDAGDAGLEFMMIGPTLEFASDTVIAITGGETEPRIDGAAVPLRESLAVKADSRLEVGPVKQGLRGYIAFAGGIDVPPFLGSRATQLGIGLGGFEGRPLQDGDGLQLFDQDGVVGQQAPEGVATPLSAEATLHVVMGPQDAMFDDASREAFLQAAWKLQPVSNRMGFRFSGPPLTFTDDRPSYFDRDGGANPSNIVDDIIPFGGIQCPSGAELILMGVEHPTAGGYAKIATVISPDLSIVGQMRPGSTARFHAVTLEEAVARNAEVEARLDALVPADTASRRAV